MRAELVGTDGVLGQWDTGDARDSTDHADDITLISTPSDLPRACARDGESRRQTWERLRREARAVGMTRKAAISYASREVEVLHPHFQPMPEPEVEVEPPTPEPVVVVADPPASSGQPPPVLPSPSSCDGVQGLGDIPADWPTLPPNASLQAEVAWVQGNRVLVVQDGAVDLSRALSPAPSYAAIAWLETSILYPAKFADVCVKASDGLKDDADDVRRERIALGEVRALLSDAMAAE